MGKKPGSWKKINKLTGKARIVSNNGKYRIGIFSLLFLAGTASFGVSSYFFMSKIINFGGIQTTGNLPNWNFKKGSGFEVDFAKAPLNHIPKDLTKLESEDIYDEQGNLYRQFSAPSLRLQYAYNEIVNNAASKYISVNPFYKVIYPDASKVEILNIYTDDKKTKALSLDDVSANNFDILDCVLFLEINYNGVLVNNTVVMPTIFYGNEGFLSNFLQFNLLNNMHKNGDNNLHPKNQSSIIGAQSNNILMDINKENYDNETKRDHTDKLYETYEIIFDDFFNKNIGKEFQENDTNPYSNFVMSGASTQDQIKVGGNVIEIDDTKDLLDINQVFSLGTELSQDDTKNTKLDISGLDSIKHLKAFFLFFKNIYVQTGSSFAFSDNYFKNTVLENIFKDVENRYVTTSMENNIEKNDQYYFMFLPEELEVRELLDNLHSEIIDVLNKAASGKVENIEDLLTETFENIKKDLLKKGKNSKHWWLFKNDFLPFQSYWTSESKDYEVTKQRVQQGVAPYSLIDKPNLNEIIDLNEKQQYDLNTADDMVKVFSDLWSTSRYGKNINEIYLTTGSYEEIQEEWLQNTNNFLSNLNSSLVNKTNLSLIEWNEKFEMKLQFLDNYNKPTELVKDAYSVDIIWKSKNGSLIKSLEKITFRMKINWTN